jgi:hypothetical protein
VSERVGKCKPCELVSCVVKALRLTREEEERLKEKIVREGADEAVAFLKEIRGEEEVRKAVAECSKKG